MQEKSMSVLEERLYKQAEERVNKSEMILEQRLAGLYEHITRHTDTVNKIRALEDRIDKLLFLVNDTRRDKEWTDVKVKDCSALHKPLM